jgi:hypothetical protein
LIEIKKSVLWEEQSVIAYGVHKQGVEMDPNDSTKWTKLSLAHWCVYGKMVRHEIVEGACDAMTTWGGMRGFHVMQHPQLQLWALKCLFSVKSDPCKSEVKKRKWDPNPGIATRLNWMYFFHLSAWMAIGFNNYFHALKYVCWVNIP